MSFTIDDSDLRTKLKILTAKVRKEFATSVKEVAEGSLARIRSGRYYVNRTGALSASFSAVPAGEFGATVSSASPVAHWIDAGTRDHGPKTKRFLVFKLNGATIFAKRVRGIKARRIEINEKVEGGLELVTRAEQGVTNAVASSGLA